MPPKKDAGPVPTLESLKAITSLLERAAKIPTLVAQVPMDLVTDIQMAGYRFQHACDKVDRERNLAKEREAKAAQILADATAREAEKLPIIQRAEAAELALGQAVMKQERIITELEKAKAEIEKLKEEAETRKRKGGDDEAAEVNDKAGGMQASGSKKARR